MFLYIDEFFVLSPGRIKARHGGTWKVHWTNEHEGRYGMTAGKGLLLGLFSVVAGLLLHTYAPPGYGHILMFGFFLIVNGLGGYFCGHLYRRVWDLSMKDPLTGITNRRGLFAQAERMLKDAEGAQESLAVVLIDLDAFKSVNDLNGHAVGDELLEQVARCIQNGVRSCDLVSRYGGDEFVLVLPKVSEQEASHIVERIRGAVQETHLVNLSAGIATYPADGRRLEALLERADLSMYQERGIEWRTVKESDTEVEKSRAG